MPSGQMKTEEARKRIGHRFGRLLITNLLGANKFRRALYECACDCGNICEKPWPYLHTASNPNCGCLTKSLQADAHVKHGNSTRAGETRIYTIWKAIHKRCSNPNDKGFVFYGAKGIFVCGRWSDFANFLADMGPDPGKGFDIDRIDPKGPYSPDNCRWLSASVNRSRRLNNIRTS